MSSVEDKIVSMTFENRQFETAAKATMSTLDRLKAALSFKGGDKGLTDLQNKANRFSMDRMKKTVTGANQGINDLQTKTNKFSTTNMQKSFTAAGQGVTDLQNKTNRFSFSGFRNAFVGASEGVSNLQAKVSRFTIDPLKNAFGGANHSVDELQSSVNRFSMSTMTGGITDVSKKFIAMSTIAITALANIANRAVNAGLQVANSFTFAPIMAGFREYETQLNSVQTILANTKASGATLKDVNATLKQLNDYSDNTIYNFGEMARNIGTFTAAGVDLKTSTESIKGIANLAALSGSNSQQASSAMYQLSQAISAGRVGLQDWNSVVTAGMGGTVFQRALAQTAEKMGTLSEGSVKLTGKMKNATINGESFRNSIMAKPGEESWLTSEVLTSTLKQFTGDMSDAELATMGFNKAQIKSIQEQAETAFHAAQDVKTLSQLMGTLQEAAGSGWAQTSQIIFGDFKEAKLLFTPINDALGDMIKKSAKARNDMLKGWKDRDGRKNLISGLANSFTALISLIKPIQKAFRDIFPPTTGKQLADLTNKFLAFSKKLIIGEKTAGNIRRTFRGVFAVFDIGVQFVKAIFNVLGDLFGLIRGGSGGFLEITGSIGDWLVSLDKAIEKGDVFNKFFEGLGTILSGPLAALGALGGAIVTFFKNLEGNPLKAVSKYLGSFGDRLKPLGGLAAKVGAAWNGLLKIFGQIGRILGPSIDTVKNAFSGIGRAIAESFKAGNFKSVFDILNTGLLAGIAVAINKFFKNGLSIDFGGTSGLVESIKGTFDTLTGSLVTLQTQIKAKSLLMIAAALAILTAAVVVLAEIDSEKLSKALTAMAAGFTEMLVAMGILSLISGSAGFAKIPIIAASMIALSVAVLILTAAVKNLSDLDWNELAKGLTGVAALLGMIVLTAKGLSKSSGSILRAGLAMIPLAIGLKILATVVKDFADMEWGDMARGLVGLAGALVVIAGAMNLMPKGMIVQAAGLVVLGVALKLIASAVGNMGDMSWGEIAKGLTLLAGSLLILAGGLYLMSGTLPGSAGLLIAAAALTVLVPVLQSMGDMSWADIGKGLATLAASLVVLAGGLTLMSSTLPGSAALLIAAGALRIFVPILERLGAMKWSSILKGLAAMAGVFLVLGLSALILSPLVPVLMAIAVAFALLGATVGLVGVGLIAIASAFSIFAAAGAAGIAVLSGMITLLPALMAGFALGIAAFVTTIASQGKKIVNAVVSLIGSILTGFTTLAPQIGAALNVLIETLVNVLVTNVPKIAMAGLTLIKGLLTAINQNMPAITTLGVSILTRFIAGLAQGAPKLIAAGTSLITRYMNGVAQAWPKIIAAGANLIVKFLNGVSNNIGRVIAAGTNVIVKFLNGVARNIGRIVEAGANLVVKFLNGIARNAPRLATAATNVIVRFLGGIARNMPRLVTAGVTVVTKFMNGIGNAAPRLANSGVRMVIKLVNGIAGAIRSHQGEMNAAGRNIGSAIVSGLASGISGAASGAIGAAISVARQAISSAKAALGVNSPSKEFAKLGRWSSIGLAEGFITGQGFVKRAANSTATTAMKAVQESMSGMSDLVGPMNVNPVITPILDLSNVTQNAAKIGGMLDQKALSADLSYRQALGISNDRQPIETPVAPPVASSEVKEIKFEQNIHAPKSPSAIDVYRNTKNLISLAKEALNE